ncbi:MAG: hypothetical protein J6S60_04030 [Oscillospiraceae bacterium]|nr:hypothetical protein [Oscillospiraceae bacterium]
MKLTEPLPRRVRVGRMTYFLRPAFDRVMRALSILGRDDLLEADRINAACRLILWPVPGRRRRAEALNAAIEALTAQPYKASGDGPRTMDYDYDAGAIYASFMAQYGIDLTKERGRLHWCKFQALLAGLGEDTQMMQISDIRARKLPSGAKKTQAQQIAEARRELMRLKAIYALPVDEDAAERRVDDGFKRLAEALLANADIREESQG